MNKNKKNKTSKQSDAKKRNNLIFGIVNGAVLLALVVMIVVIVVLLNKKDKEEEVPKRFEDLTHITVEEYQAIINEGDESKRPEDLEFYNVYVFVYNPYYDDCSLCESLDEIIKEKALEEGSFNFYVLNIEDEDNAGYGEILPENNLPNGPLLIHIQGEEVFEFASIKAEIETILANI